MPSCRIVPALIRRIGTRLVPRRGFVEETGERKEKKKKKKKGVFSTLLSFLLFGCILSFPSFAKRKGEGKGGKDRRGEFYHGRDVETMVPFLSCCMFSGRVVSREKGGKGKKKRKKRGLLLPLANRFSIYAIAVAVRRRKKGGQPIAEPHQFVHLGTSVLFGGGRGRRKKKRRKRRTFSSFTDCPAEMF